MKVLMLNGSPHVQGNTALALREMEKVFAEEEIETEIVQVGSQPVRSCVACMSCRETGRCVMDGLVNDVADKLEQADGMVVASPVYYAAANPALTALLTRLFYSSDFDKTMKVGTAVVVARRGGTTAAFDELNKFFTISGMPVASSRYWNNLHGSRPGEAEQDREGIYVVRTLARNMAFLMKSIALGKEKYGLPEKFEREATNFIR